MIERVVLWNVIKHAVLIGHYSFYPVSKSILRSHVNREETQFGNIVQIYKFLLDVVYQRFIWHKYYGNTK